MDINYKVIEITSENEPKYIAGVVELEKSVLAKMEQEGKVGQLFITGKEGIQEYVESPSNHVMIAVSNDDEKIISATYITQGQVDYTYNDITKYFKCDENYKEYVKSKYSTEAYKRAVREVYIEKINAFKYVRDLILNQRGMKQLKSIPEEEKNLRFLELVEKEYNDKQNGFHEKSNLREDLNKYMSMYMKGIKKDSARYQDFYWVNFADVKSNSQKDGEELKLPNDEIQSTISTYDKVLEYQKYKIYDTTHCKDMSKYYTANPSNTIELDTYITDPTNREKGIARIIVYEGIKKALSNITLNRANKDVFLVSTLHADNFSSKYVSEFFGLKDYLFVNRRNGRDRQVHIFGMKREDVPEYLEKMEKKIAVLYGYNPNNIDISDDERNQILQDQIKYEVDELERLKSLKNFDTPTKYTGYIKCKESKIESLKRLANDVENEHKNKDVDSNNYANESESEAQIEFEL